MWSHTCRQLIVILRSGFLLLILSLAFALSSGCTSLGFVPSSCRVQSQNLVAPDSDLSVDISFYESLTPVATHQNVIIMPPTGGTNYIDKAYAREFCAAGLNVYIVNTWSKFEDDTVLYERHQNFYVRGQQAISLVITHIPDVEPIGLLGTSLGALHGSLAAVLQPRITKVFLIVGGTPIREIIMHSSQQAMIDLRKKRLEYYHLTDLSQIDEALKKSLTYEVGLLGDGYKNKKIGMSIALSDITVPTENQKKLQDIFKPIKVLEHHTNHFWGIVNTWLFDSGQVTDFFKN